MLTLENTHRTLHVFNPSHDEALAAGTPYYYPSVIARKLASAWALLPALWANKGDVVWVCPMMFLPHLFPIGHNM